MSRTLVTYSEALIDAARNLLAGNWTGAFTRPSASQYPHQWNWDAGFIATGYAHFDQERAQQELRHLFSAQWKTGMVPHIVYRPDASEAYFPSHDFWQTDDLPHGPDRPTSGLTMPPVHPTAALHIYRHAGHTEKARTFLRELYPCLFASVRYFYEHRDPYGEGLAYIRHPWESGTDNAPTWDKVLAGMDLSTARLPHYERKDQQAVAAEQRPTDADYDHYIFLLDLQRRLGYRDRAILRESPFLVQDPLFNSILCRACEDLITIADLLGEETCTLERWHRRTRQALNLKLWNEERGVYDAFDLYRDRPIPMHSISGFLPLFAGVASQEQADRLVEHLTGPGFEGDTARGVYRFPSHDLRHHAFSPHNYWRGPVWVNVNWMLYHGLRRYGFEDLSEAVRRDTLELIDRYGFYEYFSPFRSTSNRQGGGYGADRFSWTAALCIDLLLDN